MTNQKLIITKSNDLIENYIFNATEHELQILQYAVSRLNTLEDNKNVVSTLYIQDIANTFKTKSNRAYEHYKNALFRLMKREYSYYDNNNKRHTENLVIRVTEDLSDDSYLVFKFNDYISKRLSNLQKLFTSYDLKYIAMFKSRYAFMLYEFFKMKISQSENKIYHQKISVEDFKNNLNIQDKYKSNSHLKLYVLDVAKNNINKHSDLNLSYTEIKTSRKITHIKFTVKYKTKKLSEEKKQKNKKNEIEHQEELKFTDEKKKEIAKKAIYEMKKHFHVK